MSRNFTDPVDEDLFGVGLPRAIGARSPGTAERRGPELPAPGERDAAVGSWRPGRDATSEAGARGPRDAAVSATARQAVAVAETAEGAGRGAGTPGRRAGYVREASQGREVRHGEAWIVTGARVLGPFP